MVQHINFLGCSTWVARAQEKGAAFLTATRNHRLNSIYSPIVLASYSFLFSPLIGLSLYGINLSRRGDKLKGWIFLILSVALICLGLLGTKNNNSPLPLFNILTAISLYQSEQPHFDRAIRQGAPTARWGPPLVGVLLCLCLGWLTYLVQ
jgi:hypothetical protein